MSDETNDNRIIQSEFRPPWWLTHRHLQTILPSMPWASGNQLKLRREVLELPDGDTTAIDWPEIGDEVPQSAPLLVILHGLEGSAESSYAQAMMRAAVANQWRSCVLHFRDCGDYRNRLPRRYHAGETNDLRHFLEIVHKDGQTGPVMAVGYSLGGNILLKYLGESGADSRLQAASAVCVPLNLYICAGALKIGFSRFYQKVLLKNMKESVARKFDRHTAAFDWERAMGARDFYEFDDVVTAPLHGFTDVQDYYNSCSSAQFLKDIARPTLVINALDDPFMTPEVIPDESQISGHVQIEASEHGGHVGFVEGGTPWRPKFYLPRRVVSFLSEQL